MSGSLAPFALAAEQFPLIPLLSAMVVWRVTARHSHATSTTTFMSRLSYLPERWIAVIVRHRILKQRLDDSPRRRSSAWRDANAMLANLIHPMVYAPGANMPQDTLDDRRVIDE